uniref:Uncharacterized protein n=1 Tax=Leviviridae sp. TaxID=2027243 RepID=A0A514D6D7_9VIRU|nr:MAG: hypothetical protein H1RhizoLitter31782_000003 [Leviviridae sp.]
MSFTDPLSITIGGVTTPLPRTGDAPGGGDGTVYRSGDGLIVLTASHDVAKRQRRVLRIDTSKLAADPFKPAENVKVSMSNYIVFDIPPAGYTPAEALAVYTGFKTLYTATSDAMIVKLLGGES